jgi:crotonobetainyl-CoA:carnitine CoA-transferase CaiB-like acyl-CoA transferase
MSGPLTGLRVVDFSRVLAGPLCADTLRRLGADVIKIEPPTPDISRFAYPRRGPVSGYYAQFNSGKRAISLDLRAPGARGVALALCDRADIVVENFRAGTLASFELDYASLADRNPGLIYVSITGYGQRGPWSARSAYAPAVQAEAGLTANSWRHYGATPSAQQTDSMSHADLYSGLHGVIAVLAALHQRGSSGRGQHIDVAMAAVSVAVNERLHADLAADDLHDEPAALGATDTPFFRTSDGETVTTAGSLVGSLTFGLYVRAMRRPDLLDDPRFATASARAANLTDLQQLVGSWVRSFPTRADLGAQLSSTRPRSLWAPSAPSRNSPTRTGPARGAPFRLLKTDRAAATRFRDPRGSSPTPPPTMREVPPATANTTTTCWPKSATATPISRH